MAHTDGRILAVIPARGGSKGIPKKNIVSVAGKPLLAYTVDAIRQAAVTDLIFVSTDAPDIAAVARDYGARVIDRPSDLSTDSASTEPALLHALETVKQSEGIAARWVLTLQPTSPLRRPETIRRFVAQATAQSEYDAMLSLHETHSDHWIRTASAHFQRLFPNAPRRRQDRDPLYVENSALYLTRADALIQTKSILGTRCDGFLMDAIEAVDINDKLDLEWVEFLLSRRLTGNPL